MRTTTKLCGSTATTTGRPCENPTTDGRGCYLHRDGVGVRHGGGQPIGLPPATAIQDDPDAEVAESESDLEQDSYFSAMMQDGDTDKREAVAADTNAPEDVLRAAARDKIWNVRRAAAGNPNTPGDVLWALVQDEDWHVRWAVAWNLNAPQDALRITAQDKNWQVRKAAAGNPNTPGDVLWALVQDEDWYVREEAARNLEASERARAVVQITAICGPARRGTDRP